MKASPLLISWHDDNAPIYSVHFDSHGKGRFATAANDNNIRLWKLEANGEDRRVAYLSTLAKHTQAVNVVRFCPKGEMLASAGDDGNVLLWVPSETPPQATIGAEPSLDDKEVWRVKHMCRSSGAEIYDLAWSPDGVFIITGSMDNVARIYNAQTGQMVRQIAEHSHYVQGVAWDPLNEYVATQSSDRSVHIYSLKTKDGQFTLTTHGKFQKMDLPARRISSNSPAPPDFGHKVQATPSNPMTISSPGPSTPGTPMNAPLPMDPPPVSLSRRSSFGSSPSIRRSASPAPSIPLPAVKPLEASSPSLLGGLGVKNASIYANESFNSFFRRLTFAPDGSLLFTPAGQYKVASSSLGDSSKITEDIINTVYIYTRAGFNKPPVAHLPGHKKPSVAVKCSPIFYNLREGIKATRRILLDSLGGDESFTTLPESINTPRASQAKDLQPSATPYPTRTSEKSRSLPSLTAAEVDLISQHSSSNSAFSLPYRMVYAVATQDSVLVYDTQQQTPLCIVSNLHFATFTDLTWSDDGLTLIMSSSDGFCSVLSFAPGELGQVHPVEKSRPHIVTGTPSSVSHTPPTTTSSAQSKPNTSSFTINTTPLTTTTTTATSISYPGRSVSPSGSVVSIASTANPFTTTISSASSVMNNPTPILGTVPSVTAMNSAQPFTSPPATPMSATSVSAANSVSGSVLGKRDIGTAAESERDDRTESDSTTLERAAAGGQPAPKRKRIAPTLVSSESSDTNNPPG